MAMVVVVVERDIDRLVTNASTVFGQDAATDGKIHETFPSVPTPPPLSQPSISVHHFCPTTAKRVTTYAERPTLLGS